MEPEVEIRVAIPPCEHCGAGADEECSEDCTARVDKPKGAFEVCSLCEGHGTVVNPAIDAHGLSADDFAEDPDFTEAYTSGAYDITCPRCNGVRVLRADVQTAIREREYERAADRRLAAREDGDFEAYCSAGDPRWG